MRESVREFKRARECERARECHRTRECERERIKVSSYENLNG